MRDVHRVKPWLTIIGLGEDGIAGLGDEAERRIAAADLVCGGRRHIELTRDLIGGDEHIWLSPIERSVDVIVAARGRKVTVLASGDPFHFGIGATLSRRIGPAEMLTISAPSSFSLAAARLGWPLQDVACVSLHGRPLELVRRYLQPGARVLALTSDETGPSMLAALLVDSGFGQSRLIVLESLGGDRERITRHVARDFALPDADALNICALEVAADENARVLTLASGLDDSLFESDGQLTKRHMRAITLSSLAPRKGQLLWDVGGGSGSISIEWMLADPAMRAIAIEEDGERSARIGRNARALGVPGLQVVTGRAPDALTGLERPDAIFIGGGGSDPGVLDVSMSRLRPGGRLVANGVTLEMEALLLEFHSRHGGSLSRIDVAQAAPIGAMQGWRPAMPVLQWIWGKPAKDES